MKKVFTYAMLVMSMCLFTACPSDGDDDDSTPNSTGGNGGSVVPSPQASMGLYNGGRPFTLYEFNNDGTVRQSTFKSYETNVLDDVYTYSYFPEQIRILYNVGSTPNNEITLTLQDGRITKQHRAGALLYEYEYDANGCLERVIEYMSSGRKMSEWGVTWKDGDIVETSQYAQVYNFVFVPSDMPTSVAHDGRYNPLIYALGKDNLSLYSMRWAFPLVRFFGTQPRHLVRQVLNEWKNQSVYSDKLQDYVKADIMIGYNHIYEQQNGKLTKVRQNLATLDMDGNWVTTLNGGSGTIEYELRW